MVWGRAIRPVLVDPDELVAETALKRTSGTSILRGMFLTFTEAGLGYASTRWRSAIEAASLRLA